MAKLIFKERKSIKKISPKLRLLNLPRISPKGQRSNGFGNYPIPTGRILERYADKHKLSEAVPIVKKLLSDGPKKLIGVDEDIDRSKPKKKVTYHEAVRRFKNVNPSKDSDGDGVLNIADCRPFDKNKQDIEKKDYYGPHGKNIMNDDFKVEEDVDVQYDDIGHLRKARMLHIKPSLNAMHPHGVTVPSSKAKKLETFSSKKSKADFK